MHKLLSIDRPRQIGSNTFVVSLDSLQTPGDNYHQGFVDYLTSEVPAGSTLIGTILWEYTDPTMWIATINAIAEKFNLILVLEDVYRAHASVFAHLNDVVYYEFSILRTYFEIYVRKTNNINLEWNPSADEFLFLTGKPASLQRAGLLSKFWKNNLLDCAQWSSFIDEENFDNCCAFIDKEDQAPFKSWLNAQWSSPDDVCPPKMNGSMHYRGFPFDPALFKNTAFRVVSETSMKNNNPVLTEKTYTTILNRHPFIIAGDYGSLQELKNNGFRTYENYMLIQDYDTIESPQDRLVAIIENTKHFLSTFKLNTDAIKEDTEYNFQAFHKSVKENEQILKDALARAGCPNFNIYVAIAMWDTLVDKWPGFYYNVKDPSWPDCFNEDKFRELPEHVQQECIEVFGYQPKN
jgi:hypothetical protein